MPNKYENWFPSNCVRYFYRTRSGNPDRIQVCLLIVVCVPRIHPKSDIPCLERLFSFVFMYGTPWNLLCARSSGWMATALAVRPNTWMSPRPLGRQRNEKKNQLTNGGYSTHTLRIKMDSCSSFLFIFFFYVALLFVVVFSFSLFFSFLDCTVVCWCVVDVCYDDDNDLNCWRWCCLQIAMTWFRSRRYSKYEATTLSVWSRIPAFPHK